MTYICRGLFAALLSLCLSLSAAASSWMFDDASEEFMVEKFSPAVVWLFDQTSSMSATGAMVTLELGRTPKALIASNFHLLRSTSDVVYFWVFDESGDPVRQRAGFWAGDSAADVALFDMRIDSSRGIRNINGVLTVSDTNRAIGEGNISDGEEIRRGRSVVFLGFPLNYGVVKSFASDGVLSLRQKVPVLKHGKVAWTEGSDWVLVDGMNNHGNSGSPVFARAETPTGDPTFKMIGVMSSFEPDTAGDIVFPDGSRAPIPHNSGLAKVVSIHAIRRIFQERMRKELAGGNAAAP